MGKSKSSSFRWGVLKSVVPLGVALLLGFVIGYAVSRKTTEGKPATKQGSADDTFEAQRLIDILTQPLPMYDGLTPVLSKRLAYGVSSNVDDQVRWSHTLAFDVTDRSGDEINAIPEFYRIHFYRAIPFMGGYGGHPMEYRLVQRDNGFQLWGGGGAFTKSWGIAIHGKYADVDIYVTVIDFDKTGKRHAVQHLHDPVNGQRVLWLRFFLRAHGLSGPAKWPPHNE